MKYLVTISYTMPGTGHIHDFRAKVTVTQEDMNGELGQRFGCPALVAQGKAYDQWAKFVGPYKDEYEIVEIVTD